MTIPQPPRQPITRVTYPKQMPTGGTANAMPDDTTRLRAELASEDSDRIARGGALIEERLRAENEHLRDELAEAQRSANVWKTQAERWERDHRNSVLPYTVKLEDQRDDLQARIENAVNVIDDLFPDTTAAEGRLLRRIRAALTQVSQPQPAPVPQDAHKHGSGHANSHVAPAPSHPTPEES